METNLEHILINSYKTSMISYMDAHPEDFEELITLSVSDKKPYSWRAAWLLWSCMKENDQQIQPNIKNMIETISARNEDQQRELCIILQKMELPREYEGELFNTCVSIWMTHNKKPSVRFNAFKILIKIAWQHPELSNELILLTQNEYMEGLSETVKKSILRLMHGFDKKE